MSDQPILFSGSMVRALIDGTKTQTRRIIKPQPPAEATSAGCIFNSREGRTYDWTWLSGDPSDVDTWTCLADFRLRIREGDRLYVREAWRVSKRWDDTPPRDLPPRKMSVVLEAGGSICNEGDPLQWIPSEWPDGEVPDWIGRLRPGMHMPRWASRITLIVEGVKIERLRDISREDARAEGLEWVSPTFGVKGIASTWREDPRDSYFALWDHINGSDGPASWTANPWVVAYTFRRIMGNIDQIGDSDASI